MPFAKDKDCYQWIKFTEHWGFFGIGIFIMFVAWSLMVIPDFFENLQGKSWVCVCAASFAFMLTGAALITYAKLPAYRGGRFFSFGVKSVAANLTGHYAWGWRLFILGVALSIGLILF
jgi:hypothetical protein